VCVCVCVCVCVFLTTPAYFRPLPSLSGHRCSFVFQLAAPLRLSSSIPLSRLICARIPIIKFSRSRERRGVRPRGPLGVFMESVCSWRRGDASAVNRSDPCFCCFSAAVIKSRGKGYGKCHSADVQLRLGRHPQLPGHPWFHSNIQLKLPFLAFLFTPASTPIEKNLHEATPPHLLELYFLPQNSN